jgi:hypothetical protein
MDGARSHDPPYREKNREIQKFWHLFADFAVRLSSKLSKLAPEFPAQINWEFLTSYQGRYLEKQQGNRRRCLRLELAPAQIHIDRPLPSSRVGYGSSKGTR